MHVSDFELFEVPPRWLFLRLETSDGLVGWGEPVVEGRTKTVRTAVDELVETQLLDTDPMAITDVWQRSYRGGFYRGGPVLMSAIAGVDQALWDIKGQRFGAPIYELLGGRVRDRVRVYRSVGGEGPAALADAAASAVEDGFTALKVNPVEKLRRIETPAATDRARKRVEAVRETVGPEIDIGVDLHGRTSKPMAKRLAAALEPAEPMFIEEPLLPEHGDALSEVTAHTTVPIATGERLYSRWDFKPLFESGAVDVVQPDPSHAGGITEVRNIATMAEAYDVALAPHCPLGPIALAACLQIDACTPNALVQEQRLDGQYGGDGGPLDYLAQPTVFDPHDGYVEIPDGPGLGIEVDEQRVRERAGDIDWHNPMWRHDDGSVAEW